MPRSARKQSSSGIYHVMLRGINRQRIFHEEADYQSFTEALHAYRDVCGFQLYAWCLMPNHIHLLIRESPGGETISQIMKRIGVKYVSRYNLRYERNGPLFQDRFKSEAIQDDAYFMTVLQYIHRNPVKAGITEKPGDYLYSSYSAYFSENLHALADTAMLYSLMDRGSFEAWHEQDDGIACLDMDSRHTQTGITDEKALGVMKKASGATHAEAFLKLPGSKQEKAMMKMRQSGASLRQISRLTGISMAMVRKSVVL